MRNLADKFGRVDEEAVEAAINDITDDPDRRDAIYKLVEEVRDIQREKSYDDGYESAAEAYSGYNDGYADGYSDGLAEGEQ